MVNEFIDEIVKNGTNEDMEELRDILIDLLHHEKECDYEKYKEHKMELYVIAYGEQLTDEVKDEWVEQMKPATKWSLEDIQGVVSRAGLTIPLHSVYVIMNMLYSDFGSVLGSGDDTSINNYINATKLWYYDEDAENAEENKLFRYYYNIVK